MTSQKRQILLASGIDGALLVLMSWITVRYIVGSRVAKVGDVAPNIQTTIVSAQPFSLNSLRGQAVFLNFFTL